MLDNRVLLLFSFFCFGPAVPSFFT